MRLPRNAPADLRSREPNPTLTTTPYHPYPQPLSTNNRYSGVVPVGPYAQAWQGVQKSNAVAGVGRFWARYGYLNLTAQSLNVEFPTKANPMGTYRGPGIANGPSEAAAAMIRAPQKDTRPIGIRVLSRLSGKG